MWLTPAERRGAVFLVVILLTGAAWDLWRARVPRPAPAAVARPTAPQAAPVATGDSLPPSGRLDLNRAPAAAFDALPGIGPVLANRIVERRARAGPYRRLEELLDVPGIGPRLFERLRPLVFVTPSTGPADSVHSAKTSPIRRAVSPSERIPPDR